MESKPILSVENLSISFKEKSSTKAVSGVSFSVNENEILGIVGESGSGKSVTSMAIMGLLPKNALLEGQILFSEIPLVGTNKQSIKPLLGKEMAMIFQEPMSALNPSLTCGAQVSEMLRLHFKMTPSGAKKETLSLFEKVKLPRPKEIYKSYPHQISGGQMQRVMIAMAISCKPKLLIADEPTTALDVTVQREIINLLKFLQKETGMSLIFISHDLALVSEIADRVLVMKQGKVVEEGTAYQIFKLPRAAYTKALLASRPPLDKRLQKLPTIALLEEEHFKIQTVTPQQRALKHKKMYLQKPLLEVINLEKEYLKKTFLFRKKEGLKAVDGVSFSIFEGETVGLVGESGCGKSTLGKTLMHLEKATAGSIFFRGKDITSISQKQIRELRKAIQLIFQDPYASLNPRLLIGKAIEEPMQVHGIAASATMLKNKAIELLEKVGLDASFYQRYPHELSGGQRQRVGIARAIALEPKLIICDESVSALDISVQAQVLNLLNELKETFGFTYLFISHDLAVVKFMADQLIVMNKGRIEELGDADEIYENPKTTYTQHLIEAIPKGM
ncbi:MAG TPA: ABC transporter ATP-binding protein [Flavobacteriaceae bacterium]|nr:ABC transporter ATP-binding protein [Flavobacteriaceae bacterium]MCB9212032.1 ABC transporter ATP-binding protein [Alteromonas sp.]HPF09873.1 ABC transporter ATP-binding protein [Flavobacteriaceae bacterium]HQU19970.1 ABC transporter ATP-binding protein [Flavobacteriaceae bacterium]HQU64044.1 ABC transporter ATP-binding protein [Flavobacteriaceae bacterium]